MKTHLVSLLAVLVLGVGCDLETRVLSGGNVAALSPFDAASCSGCCEGTPSAPDAGAFDAGASDGGCAPAPCDSSNCLGCCQKGQCHPGTEWYVCGRAGMACEACAATQVCSLQRCATPSAMPDLVVEEVEITDVFAGTGDLTFTVTATFKNLGLQDATNFHWMAALSYDATLNLPYDTLVAETATPISLAGLSSRRMSLRARASPKPTSDVVYALVVVDQPAAVVELSESNNARLSHGFFTDSRDCNPGECSGCCAAGGCVVPSQQTAAECGASGASCVPCSGAQTCQAGSCQ